MTCPDCQNFKTVSVQSTLSAVDWFWHYGQVMSRLDRRKMAQAIKRLVEEEQNSLETAKQIAELLALNEVEIVIRSKHNEIVFEPKLELSYE
ncbi:MAG: hypothetical protein ACXAC5_02050 [Promethearchaeota archaeon]